jgi:OTU domain-containing protein 6
MEETFEQMQARHRKELRDLQGRITSKKKNATKKTRKFVNDACAELERQTKERQEEELRIFTGQSDADGQDGVDEQPDQEAQPQPQDQDQAGSVNDLADKLNSTTLTPHQQQEQQQPSQPPAAAAAQPKQKRNRQKERLARRAAEQEAAALAAESEAASMTDHRSLEREAMARAFAAHSLREHEIAPDGHCLFAAVADQLDTLGIPLSKPGGEQQLGDTPKVAPYRVVRRAAADWIERHRDEYAGFIEEEGGVEAYVGKIRDTAEWGGQLELSALANAYGVEIRVVQRGSRVEVVSPAQDGENGEGEEEGKKTIWLAYYRHGYGLGEHYNSLRKTG